MTTGEMLVFTNRFKEILSSAVPTHIKDQRLANLMSDLETLYKIPMVRDEKYERENPFLMQLYRTVSEARKL